MRIKPTHLYIITTSFMTLSAAPAIADVCELIPIDKAGIVDKAALHAEAAIETDAQLGLLGIVPQNYDTHAAAREALVHTASAQRAYGQPSRTVTQRNENVEVPRDSNSFCKDLTLAKRRT